MAAASDLDAAGRTADRRAPAPPSSPAALPARRTDRTVRHVPTARLLAEPARLTAWKHALADAGLRAPHVVRRGRNSPGLSVGSPHRPRVRSLHLVRLHRRAIPPRRSHRGNLSDLRP